MKVDRREFFQSVGQSVLVATAAGSLSGCSSPEGPGLLPWSSQRGSQRLSLKDLRKWEALGYGMFIHFGMETFFGKDWVSPQSPSTYAPDRLDVDQWISVARDAGMKYAVLTAKHHPFCLWPSQHSDYTVTASGNKTDVVEKFVEACRRRHIQPGLYYACSDEYHRFGSLTRDQAKRGFMPTFPQSQNEDLPPYTTSVYQTFMTAQITELLTQYGPIMEMWIDVPGELGRGYRTFLYHYMAQLQPKMYIMMNNGVPDSTHYDYHYAFPSDLLALERGLPPESGYQKWRQIEGKHYYMPGEVCDIINSIWFDIPSDLPRPDDELLHLKQACRERGTNLLLNVPPNRHGLIKDEYIQALLRLRKRAQI